MNCPQAIQDLFAKVGARVPRIFLPAKNVEFEKFAVIACDQHSAEPDYWDAVQQLVGDAPSTLELMLPEAWLDRQGAASTDSIAAAMRRYLADDMLADMGEGLILVRRSTDSGIRTGLVLALDLEQYDFAKDAKTLIRATEDTVVERLPARVAVRERASLELPHVMILIDDRRNRLGALLTQREGDYRPVYDFELMLGGGHLTGRMIDRPDDLAEIAETLMALHDESGDGFMYAMGDGNHSFAAAKLHWEQIKPTLAAEQRKAHPARYALAEIVSLYDAGLSVEPIHRLLMGVDPAQVQAEIGFDAAHPESLQLLQPRLDAWLAVHPQATLEYIHGEAECRALAAQSPDRLAIIFPPFDRESIFSIVRESGAFVRKSFSLGSASGKRYYLECRKIVDEF